jgi:hypothetical protein
VDMFSPPFFDNFLLADLQWHNRTQQSLFRVDFHHRTAWEALDPTCIVVKDSVIKIDLVSAVNAINFHRMPFLSSNYSYECLLFQLSALLVLTLIFDVRSVNFVEFRQHPVDFLKCFGETLDFNFSIPGIGVLHGADAWILFHPDFPFLIAREIKQTKCRLPVGFRYNIYLAESARRAKMSAANGPGYSYVLFLTYRGQSKGNILLDLPISLET